MSYTKTTWVNDQTELSAQNFNHLENGVEKAYGQLLLEVTSIEPEEFQVGDKYYNTDDNKIYTAIDNEGTPEWETTGETPEIGVFYIVLESQNIYTYNGETLVSVGGGGGGESLPIGITSMYAGSTAPDGFLMCDGQAVSRTTYKELFEVIGTTYGTGDGSTTFNVPNIKGKVVVMLDSSQTEFDTLGETGGEKKHTLTTSEMPVHTHSGIVLSEAPLTAFNSGSQSGYKLDSSYSSSINRSSNNFTTGQTGNGNAHNNLQPYIVLNYIIKATQTAPINSSVVNTQSDSQTDTYSCDYSNKAFGGTVLWTNPSPTSNFASQNIQLSSSDYDILEIYFYSSTNITSTSSEKFIKGTNTILRWWSTSDNKNNERGITYTNATTLAIGDCTMYNVGTKNNVLIPYKVIGYKTELF